MKCDHCTHDVPDGVFCTRCGAHLGTTQAQGDPKARQHRYVVAPGEHLNHPGIITTLFPHLSGGKAHQFRWALLVGVAGVVVLFAAGLIPAAFMLAAVLVPVLYLMYLYEAQVYRDEPALVLGFTAGGGIVLGILVTLAVRALANPFSEAGLSGIRGPDLMALLLMGLLIPVVQEVLKPLPVLPLRGRAANSETMDGLVLGVAAGLGFGMAESLITFSGVITGLPLQSDPAGWIFPLLTVAVLTPLLQGSATGLVVAAIWRQRRGRLGRRETIGLLAAFGGHIAYSLGNGVIANLGLGLVVGLFWHALVVAVLLIVVRYVLHHALLDEAEHLGFRETTCPDCRRHVVASSFCPLCGRSLKKADTDQPMASTVEAGRSPAGEA